jgi:rod shape-determining protein MreC
MSSRTAVWTVAIFILGVFLVVISRVGALSPVENAVLVVTSPAQNALSRAAEPAADFFDGLGESNELKDENARLRAENDRLETEVTRLRENEIRLQELRQLLQVKESRPDQEFLAANVFAREPSNLKEMVAIDRGKRDGVKEGMVVMTEGGSLVGRVTKLLDDSAWVTLLTDPNSAVSAMVQESRSQGVVAGSYSRRLTMDFIRQGATVNTGDVVVTSGIGGNFPPGLLIGRVVAAASTRQEIFQDVSVEPVASLSRLETILVLTSFTPQEVRAP